MNTRSDQLESFLRKDPSNVFLACDLVDELLTSGSAARAREVLQGLPAEARGQEGVRFREARCVMINGDPGEAARLLRAMRQDGMGAPALDHDLAYAEFCLGHLDAAALALAPALAEPTPLPQVLRLHARLQYWRGDLEGALRTTEAVLAMAPDDGDALGLRAIVLLDLDRVEEAAQAARASLSIDPLQADAAVVSGTLALWEQRVEDAIVAFEAITRRHPKAGRALAGQGQAHMLRGDIATARNVLEQAVAWMPDHIGTWHALAWCQLLLGDLPAARGSYDKAFALDRSFGETHGGFAVIHALRGETAEAEAAIVRARRLDPGGRSAAYAQGLLLLDAGRPDEARELIEPILKSTAQAPDTDALAFLRGLRQQMVGRPGA